MSAATLVVGSDEFLVARAVGVAVAAAGESSDLEVADLAAADSDVDELRELTSPSLFGDARLVVLRDIQDASKDLLTALVESVAGGADRLVMTHAGGAKGKSAIEGLRDAGADVVTVEAPRTARDRDQWVTAEAARRGGSIDRDAVADVVLAVGTDLRELSTVIEQLVADAGPRITSQAVATYHRGRAELTGFAVADRAVEGQVAAALEAVRWALSSGVDPVLISAALAANLRLIAQVAGASRTSPEAIAGAVKQPPWKVRRAQGWLRRWRPEALAHALTVVADADADVKGGGDDAQFAVERAVLSVASACAA